MKKIPGNLLQNLEKSWKSHGILSVRKSGNPETIGINSAEQNPFKNNLPSLLLKQWRIQGAGGPPVDQIF